MANSLSTPENLAAIEQSVDELIANVKPLEAVEVVLQYAAGLGVHFPAKPDTADITNAYADIMEALKGKAIEDLLQAPVMKDPEKNAIVQLLDKIAVPVSTLRPEIFALSTLKQVLFSIQYGNNPVSCHAYVLFAAMLSGQFNDINSAYRFGKVGLELVEHQESIQYKTTLLQIFNLFIKHWVEPVKNTLPSLELGFRHGLKNGEIAEATLCAHIFTAYSYFSAIGLPEIERALEEYESANKKHNQYLTSGYNRTFRQAIQILTGSKLPDVISLNGEIYNAGEMLKLFEAEKSSTGLFLHHFNGMILKFLFRENNAALEDSKKAEKYLHFVAGMFHFPVYVFYNALILLGNYESYSKNKKATVNSQVLEHLEKLHGWADFNAGNHQHKFDLVSAEYARVIGNDGTAREHYDKAINGAHENGFLQEEALANELAAEFYLQRGKMQFARYHILEAKNNYQAWGALAKVQDLENRYTDLFNSLKNTTGNIPAYGESFQSLKDRTLQITNSFIDLSSLIKASHSITGEFDLSNLLRKLMDILVESTGAQRGFLILENENGLFIEAEAESGNKTINVLKSLALEQASGELSIAIVNYVIRTKETVVLGSTFDTRAFSHDPYIRKNLPKSLLCVPVLMQGRIFGVLYLENNLVPDGFPEERVELLKILATQAAMVIENARLYADLEERVRTRTEELAITNSQLRGEIEEHKRTQEALFGKEKDYRIIFNSVPAMIWYVDCDGKILRGNQSAYDSLHMSENEIIGKSLHEVFRRPEAEKFSADIQEVFKTGQSKLGVIETFTTPDGNKKWSKTEKVPYYNEKNVIIGVIVISNDITAEKNADEALRLKNIELKEINATKDKFFSIIAHDMKTPFQGLIGFSQLLKTQFEFFTGEERNAIIDSLHELSLNSLKLVENLLEWARLQTGKIAYNPESFVIYDVLHPTIEMLQQSAKNKSIQLSSSIANGLLVYADKNMLETVVRNLISNAIKFTNSGGTITLSAKPLGGEIVFTVEDSGVGMEPHVMARLFSLTEGFHTKGTNNEIGTGLGLLLCKEMIDKHSGTLHVESEKGKGSRFIFTMKQFNL